MDYNKEGMPLEEWETVGGPFFGVQWFQKLVPTREKAEELKSAMLAVCRKLHSKGRIRGASLGIEEMPDV